MGSNNIVTLYANRLLQSISTENANDLKDLLSYQHHHTHSILDANFNLAGIDELFEKALESPWAEVGAAHFKVIVHRDGSSPVKAFEEQKELVQHFQRALPQMTRWCLPALIKINSELRQLAVLADQEVAKSRTSVQNGRKKIEEAANVISKSFSICLTDRNALNQSKKYAIYKLLGILFRIYFKLRQQNLCKNVLRPIKAAEMPPLDDFPKCDRVTYHYYIGRLHFTEERYLKAEEHLTSAVKLCKRSAKKQKTLIMMYLLPLRMMRGWLPSKSFWKAFPRLRDMYFKYTEMIRKGNIQGYRNSIAEAQIGNHKILRAGTLFALQRCQVLVYRRLFKKVWICKNKSNRIPMGAFQTALRVVGTELDLDEVEWILSDVIAKDLMKAYISHEKRYVVLSNTDPFPKTYSLLEI